MYIYITHIYIYIYISLTSYFSVYLKEMTSFFLALTKSFMLAFFSDEFDLLSVSL